MGAGGGLDNSGKGESAWILELAAIAVAAIDVAAAYKIADWQIDIAEQYLSIAKGWRNYYNSTFAPCENTEIAEACAAELYQKDYDTVVGRMSVAVKGQFKDLAENQLRCTSRYCTGLRGAILKDLLSAEALAVSSAMNFGYRYEDAKADAKDDLRWKRREAALNRGRDMVARNVLYSQLAYGIFGSLGAQARDGAAGALAWLGYSSQRNQTIYPSQAPQVQQQPRERPRGESFPLPMPEIEQVPMQTPRIRG